MDRNNYFHSPNKGKMDLAEIAKDVFSYINEQSKNRYKIIVGTDSAGVSRPDFITAIIVYRVGRGGRYFWRKTPAERPYPDIKTRVFHEVTLSLSTSQELLGAIQDLVERGGKIKYDFQIHIDVGEQGQTREMIKEVVGMVKGNGFEAKIKPESYAASSVADKYARK
jgi:hypothetical protein